MPSHIFSKKKIFFVLSQEIWGTADNIIFLPPKIHATRQPVESLTRAEGCSNVDKKDESSNKDPPANFTCATNCVPTNTKTTDGIHRPTTDQTARDTRRRSPINQKTKIDPQLRGDPWKSNENSRLNPINREIGLTNENHQANHSTHERKSNNTHFQNETVDREYKSSAHPVNDHRTSDPVKREDDSHPQNELEEKRQTFRPSQYSYHDRQKGYHHYQPHHYLDRRGLIRQRNPLYPNREEAFYRHRHDPYDRHPLYQEEPWFRGYYHHHRFPRTDHPPYFVPENNILQTESTERIAALEMQVIRLQNANAEYQKRMAMMEVLRY